MKKFAGFLRLNAGDFLSGLWCAVGGAVLAIIMPIIKAGSLTFDWKVIGGTALSAGVAYLGQKFLTPIPKVVAVDPAKTAVVDVTSKEVISETPTAPAPAK